MKGLQLLVAMTSLLVFLPLSAKANVDNVTANPSRISIPMKGAPTLNIAWRVARTADPGGGGGNVTVTSTNAVLRINGTAIATVGNTLAQQSNLAAGVSGVVNFNETLVFSPEQARRVASAGAGSVTITRLFNDTEITTGTGTIQLSAGNTGPLAVRRIELKFENDARTDVVQQGDTLRAVADVSFRSNGLLRGEWRIVDASASLGTARGRVLQVVRQQLVSSGEGRTRVVSPLLPTKTNGLHLVSFSVEDTDGNITVPILRYFVLEGRDNVPPTNLSILTPGDNAIIDQISVFSWSPLAGAQAYQLEIFEKNSEKQLAGKIVPGSDLKLSLSALTFEDLMSGKTYDWRVRAFAGGKIIGQSERMSLYIP